MLLTALAVHAGSLVVFATATGVPALLGARVVQGLSTGAALGAIGAAMLDMDRGSAPSPTRWRRAWAARPARSCPRWSVRFLPDPTHLIYLALIGVLALQAAAIARDARDGHAPHPGALASLRAGDHPAAGAAGPGADRRAGAVRGVGAGRVVRRRSGRRWCTR